MKIENIRACVFDAYGTLFDVNSAAAKCKKKLGSKWEGFANAWRTTQLEYTWLRSLMKKHKNFWEITVHVCLTLLVYIRIVLKKKTFLFSVLFSLQHIFHLDIYAVIVCVHA